MTETRIRRGSTRRMTQTGAPSGRRTMPRRRRGKATGWERLIALSPIGAAGARRLAIGGGVLALLGAAWGTASFLGLPEMAWMEAAELARDAGYQVRNVQVRGTRRMDENQVYEIALQQADRSMLSVDLPALRSELMKLHWVKDARISRRLPDTLVIDIEERQPVAVWQNDGQLTLIDGKGTPLDVIAPDAMPDLPLLIGPSANRRTADLSRLLDNAPALKPMLTGAVWVGNRRWDLRLQSGETLQLPEGETQAAAALVNFARMDGVNRLLGRGIVRFDMRDPDRFVLRLPPEGGVRVPAGMTAEPDEKTGDGAEGRGGHDKATALGAWVPALLTRHEGRG